MFPLCFLNGITTAPLARSYNDKKVDPQGLLLLLLNLKSSERYLKREGHLVKEESTYVFQ